MKLGKLVKGVEFFGLSGPSGKFCLPEGTVVKITISPDSRWCRFQYFDFVSYWFLEDELRSYVEPLDESDAS